MPALYATMDLSRREPRKINGGKNMSNFAHKLLKVVEDKAQRAATHPRFWAYEDGELKPDLYQLDLALETLES